MELVNCLTWLVPIKCFKCNEILQEEENFTQDVRDGVTYFYHADCQ